MKDYLPPDEQEKEIVPQQKIRSAKNPNGVDRKNRLGRDFNSDISIRKDQAQQFSPDQSDLSWDPQEYL